MRSSSIYLFQNKGSAREDDPPVQGGGAPLTPAARPDSGGVSDALDDIAQADLLVPNKSRHANPKRIAF
jgi:hypothetical protein